jgi:hypothetical protein
VLGSATSTGKGLDIENLTPDGILGMAYQSISDFGGSPVFQSLVAQGQVPQPVFAFYFAQSESELFVGGVNSNHYTGSFTYVPVETQVRIWRDVSPLPFTSRWSRASDDRYGREHAQSALLLCLPLGRWIVVRTRPQALSVSKRRALAVLPIYGSFILSTVLCSSV